MIKSGWIRKRDAVFFESPNWGSANCFASQWKPQWVAKDALDCCLHFRPEPASEAHTSLLIPTDGVLKFKPRLPVEDYLAAHFRFLSLSGSSAQICSHGIPLSGLRASFSARRSASARSVPRTGHPQTHQTLPEFGRPLRAVHFQAGVGFVPESLLRSYFQLIGITLNCI